MPREFADPKEAPCLVIGKLGRVGKLQRITVIELNQEGLLDLGSVKVLLKESVDLFKDQLAQDIRFIDNYENKVKMRRLIQSQGMAPQARMQQQDLNPLIQAMMAAHQPDPAESEYQRQQEFLKKQQLERERK